MRSLLTFVLLLTGLAACSGSSSATDPINTLPSVPVSTTTSTTTPTTAAASSEPVETYPPGPDLNQWNRLDIAATFESFTSALAAGEYDFAATLWQTEQEDPAGFLADLCAPGCQMLTPAAVHFLDGEESNRRVEIVLPGRQPPGTVTMAEVQYRHGSSWIMVGPLPSEITGAGESDSVGELADLITLEGSDLVLVRPEAIETWTGGERVWTPHSGINLVTSAFERGWLWREGQFLSVRDPDLRCDYSSLAASDGVVGDLVDFVDGELVAQLRVGPGGENRLMYDCVSQQIIDAEPLTADLPENGGFRRTMAAGDTLIYEIVRSDEPGGLSFADGSPLTSDQVSMARLSPDGTSVAYRRGNQFAPEALALRDTATGDLLGEWNLALPTEGEPYFDGRWILVNTDSLSFADPEEQMQYAIVAIDTENGEIYEFPIASQIGYFGP